MSFFSWFSVSKVTPSTQKETGFNLSHRPSASGPEPGLTEFLQAVQVDDVLRCPVGSGADEEV